MIVPSEEEEIAILKRLRRMKRWKNDQANYTSKEESTSKTCSKKETSDTPNASEKLSDGSVSDMSKEYTEKLRLVELDRQALEIKQKYIELDHQALEIKQKHIELDRQASIAAAENKQRMIELDRQEFELSEMKKKRAREEEREGRRRYQSHIQGRRWKRTRM